MLAPFGNYLQSGNLQQKRHADIFVFHPWSSLLSVYCYFVYADTYVGSIDDPVEDGDTVLHLSCLYGHLPCVQVYIFTFYIVLHLFRRFSLLIVVVSNYGHLACYCCNVEQAWSAKMKKAQFLSMMLVLEVCIFHLRRAYFPILHFYMFMFTLLQVSPR
jgi:hypothetical protein